MGVSDKHIVAFDTSAAHCAAAVGFGDVLGQGAVEAMTRGQAERLIPLVEELMLADGIAWSQVGAIGVGVGPGNFTGIRISVSAARGLALALGIPAVPLSAFELARDPDGSGAIANELVVLEAPRGRAYAQPFRYGRPTAAPELIDPEAISDAFRQPNLTVTGHMADRISGQLGGDARPAATDDLPRRMIKLLDWKLHNGHDLDGRPAPLYVRPADAAPPSDPPPLILT